MQAVTSFAVRIKQSLRLFGEPSSRTRAMPLFNARLFDATDEDLLDVGVRDLQPSAFVSLHVHLLAPANADALCSLGSWGVLQDELWC